MPAAYPPPSLPFPIFRIVLVSVALLAALALWRRPRPAGAFALVVGLNLAFWAAYVAPLGRLYGLEEHLDRSFAVGMAACTAAGNSPFDHTQVGFGSPEPLWNALVAALSLFHPERVMAVYHWLPPLSLIVVAVGLYRGLRQDDSEADAWERVLIVLAVLGLSSLSMSQRPPIPALWAGNFMLKPNHASAWGLVGVAVGMWARSSRPWSLGLALGALAWVFLLDWAFFLVGLWAGVLLHPRGERRARGLILATGLSSLIAAPYVLHLLGDYNPFASGGTPRQVWLDSLGQRLAHPQWVTLDLGPLFVLGIAGTFVLWRRATSRDRALLGVLAGAWGLWIAYGAGALLGITPEPDEHHYFLRFAMALAAGTALAAAARHAEAWPGWRLRPGQGHVLALAGCLPLTFPAYWDPPTMDRYYQWCLSPLRPKVVEYGRWVRENTPPEAVFLAGPSASIWIPVLAGRRVLLAADSRPPADYAARKQAERILLTSRDPETIFRTAREFGVTYVAIDWPMTDEYTEEALKGIGQVPAYELVYRSSAVQILRIRGLRSDAARE